MYHQRQGTLEHKAIQLIQERYDDHGQRFFFKDHITWKRRMPSPPISMHKTIACSHARQPDASNENGGLFRNGYQHQRPPQPTTCSPKTDSPAIGSAITVTRGIGPAAFHHIDFSTNPCSSGLFSRCSPVSIVFGPSECNDIHMETAIDIPTLDRYITKNRVENRSEEKRWYNHAYQ
ncbi:hypothetical protein B0T17DRAFT_603656 [Bombardia bombarda]|uniref:Uncharacterized protein n=1 Tax=Bombardia bombarda TaxID=252184 RepID=A0AA39WA97_9PEZI|nr:hypothetical protein B0T17DRAFT_603656 [Bombardia bombarda]